MPYWGNVNVEIGKIILDQKRDHASLNIVEIKLYSGKNSLLKRTWVKDNNNLHNKQELEIKIIKVDEQLLFYNTIFTYWPICKYAICFEVWGF